MRTGGAQCVQCAGTSSGAHRGASDDHSIDQSTIAIEESKEARKRALPSGGDAE